MPLHALFLRMDKVPILYFLQRQPFRKFPDDRTALSYIQPIGINMDIYIPTFRQQPCT